MSLSAGRAGLRPPLVDERGRFKPVGRRKPYTGAGIRRVKCCRCQNRAHASWQACANDRLHVPLCVECDIELNRVVLEFMRFDRVPERMRRYIVSLARD